MHVSILEIVDGALVEARVDDELWRGARVPLADLPQAERAWLTKVATRAVASLDPQDDPAHVSGAIARRVRFESDDGVRARVHVGDDVRHVDVQPARRDLDGFLDAVQGALLIDEHSQGLTKRRADAPQ
jgi:hypothetical protein